jgi:hypothetical protein
MSESPRGENTSVGRDRSSSHLYGHNLIDFRDFSCAVMSFCTLLLISKEATNYHCYGSFTGLFQCPSMFRDFQRQRPTIQDNRCYDGSVESGERRTSFGMNRCRLNHRKPRHTFLLRPQGLHGSRPERKTTDLRWDNILDGQCSPLQLSLLARLILAEYDITWGVTEALLEFIQFGSIVQRRQIVEWTLANVGKDDPRPLRQPLAD